MLVVEVEVAYLARQLAQAGQPELGIARQLAEPGERPMARKRLVLVTRHSESVRMVWTQVWQRLLDSG